MNVKASHITRESANLGVQRHVIIHDEGAYTYRNDTSSVFFFELVDAVVLHSTLSA